MMLDSSGSKTSGFQFPSNGKEHGKLDQFGDMHNSQYHVSIPFKREGAWKGLSR